MGADGADGDAEAGLDLGGVSGRRGVNQADQATLGRWGLAAAITLTGDDEYRGPSNIPLAARELCALLTPLPFRSMAALRAQPTSGRKSIGEQPYARPAVYGFTAPSAEGPVDSLGMATRCPADTVRPGSSV